MLKKFLAMFISANMFLSTAVFAQYQPVDTLTQKQVEQYMSQLQVKENSLKQIHPAVYVGGVVGALAFAYAVKQIAKNPELGAYYVAAQDPAAYEYLMKVAAKHATPAQRAAITAAREAEVARMAQFQRAVSHKKWIAKVNRENYWQFVRNTFHGQWAQANKALVQLKRANALVKNPTPFYKRVLNTSAKTKWTVAISALVLYTVFGKYLTEDEESVISQNRTKLGQQVESLMKTDPDKLAGFIIPLPEEAKNIAYSILAENPDLFAKVKQQIDEALSEENLRDYDEFERLQREQLIKEDIQPDTTEVTFSGGWGY